MVCFSINCGSVSTHRPSSKGCVRAVWDQCVWHELVSGDIEHELEHQRVQWD